MQSSQVMIPTSDSCRMSHMQASRVRIPTSDSCGDSHIASTLRSGFRLPHHRKYLQAHRNHMTRLKQSNKSELGMAGVDRPWPIRRGTVCPNTLQAERHTAKKMRDTNTRCPAYESDQYPFQK